jgi:hypothetical protein
MTKETMTCGAAAFPIFAEPAMRLWHWALLTILSLNIVVAPARGGDGWNEFWHRVHVDFLRNNTWPEPFQAADRAGAREPWCIQTDNGWKMQNTVGTFLFDGETQQLNEAGELLVKWIVTQAPHHRRAVFVLKGETSEATAVRAASVQAAVSKYAGGCVCPVLLTCTEPPGWPAAYIDQMTQQFNATIPAPRLPAMDGGGASSGGGSGSGGSGSGGSSQ